MDSETAMASLFEQLSDETNLRKAWIKARHYASTSVQYFDKQAYDAFELQLEANLIALQWMLENGDYSFSPFRIFEIPKGEGARKIYFAQPKDAVVIQAMLNVIGPVFEEGLSEFSFGNRLNTYETESKEVFGDWPEQFEQYETRARTILDEPSGTWYEISDIADFYPSIDRSLLRGIIAQKLTEPQLLTLIDRLLNVQALNLNEELEAIPGLPPGPAYAHFFANLYLDDFDKFMEANTLKYFRYVDDFCFASTSQEELEDIHRRISRFFEDRSEQRMELNAGKTDQKSVLDPVSLIEHTKKLKYDLRFGVIYEITEHADTDVEEAKRNAEHLFKTLFIQVEEEEDVSKIAKESAGFIATRLEELILSQEEARNIAYGLLEFNPPKVTAIRALLGSLVNLSFADAEPRKRFIHFIRTASALVRISCLQLLSGVTHIPDDVFDLLTEDLLNDSNYFVRANVYSVIEAHSRPLELARFRTLWENEVSEYVLEHLVGCLSLVTEQQRSEIWVDIVALLDGCTTGILNAILRSLIEMLDNDLLSSNILEIVFPVIEQHPSRDLFSSVLSLYLACKYGTHEMFASSWNEVEQNYGSSCSRKLIQTVAFQTIRFFVQEERTDRLFRFSDSLARLGLSIEATVGYQELAVRSSDPELRRQAVRRRDRLPQTLVVPGLPSWYSLEDCDRGFFCNLSDEPEYKCRYFDDNVHNNRRGTLEIISFTRVQSQPDFPSPNSWLDYLNSLHSKDAAPLIECGILPSGQAFALYEIPDGYRTLRDWQGDAQFSQDEEAILSIALRIVDLIEVTKLDMGFQFLGINPCNILWNPASKQVRLINIGSSLGVPKYVCGIPQCSRPYSQKEIGVTTGSYFMGLLLLQLLSDKCPLEKLSEVDSRAVGNRSRISLADVLTELGLAPHTRSIIARMLHNKPEYRYMALSVLIDDITHILQFKSGLKKMNVRLRTEEKENALIRFTLVDYVAFRLGVIRRNPALGLSPIRKTRKILERLSRDLSYYSSDELRVWRTSFTWWRNRDEVPRPLIWLWLNPESKHLLSVACGWSNLVQEIYQDHQIEYGYDLSWLLIGWALYGELLAATQGILLTRV